MIPKKRPVVLTIDDDRFFRKCFRDILENCDYEVREAENGRIGLEMIERELPDLILLDLRMPEIDGLEVLERVREFAPDIPVIVVSGAGVDRDIIMALRLGAWDYLLKPIEDMTVLLHTVENALERTRLIRENRAYQKRLENEVDERTAELDETKTSLIESERNLESIIWQIPDVIYRLDPEGTITFVNHAVTRYGYDPDELIGKSIFEFVHPGDREVAIDRFNERRTGNRRLKPLKLRLLLRKYDNVSLESSFVEMDEWPIFSVDAEGIFSTDRPDENRFLGIQGIARDITGHEQAEQALRDSEAKYRELVQNANSMILRMDPQGNVTFFNEFAQHFFGYTEEEIFGRNIIGTIVPTIDSTGRNQEDSIHDLIRNPDRYSTVECENIRRQGDRAWLIWTNKPVYDDDGHLKELLCVGTDITELKTLKEQFLQLQKVETMGMLAGGVAHDFNNLLTVVMGCSALVLDELSPSDPLYQTIKEIYTAGERANVLTRQLLAYSRRQNLQPEMLNLNELILNMDKMLRRLIGENIEFSTIPDQTIGYVKTDPGQIEQIIMNLVINARDAMPKGGRLTIETQNAELDETYTQKHIDVQPGPYVMLAITDSGCGIDKETQKKIFDPFFTMKDKGKGTGLGLSTVFGIVKQSNGHISVYSEPGYGTSIKIYFPSLDKWSEESLGDEEALGDERADILLHGAETVLVAEDDESVLKIIQTVLSEYGYTVLMASNGVEALRTFEWYDGDIHLLITDIVMPKVGGEELAKQLTSQRPGMKVLFISGYTDNAVALNGYLDEPIHFIQKPFTPEFLLKKVRKVLGAE